MYVPQLDEICYVHGHFLNLSVVEGFYIFKSTMIIGSHKVDSNAFTAKSATTANSESENTT